MKKFAVFIFILISSISFSGCTSLVVGKYDDYRETFVGVSNYDPTVKKALIEVTSTYNKTKCVGHASAYYIPFWEFKLVCNDGRNIIGTIMDYREESRGFTNRNENVTFSVVKSQKRLDEIHRRYLEQVVTKPALDTTKKSFPANMNL